MNHAIMSIDLDKMTGMAREFYILEQTRILNETRKAAMDNVGQFGCGQSYEEILLEVPINEDDTAMPPGPQVNADSNSNDATKTVPTPPADSEDEYDAGSIHILDARSNADSNTDESIWVPEACAEAPSNSENESCSEDSSILPSDSE